MPNWVTVAVVKLVACGEYEGRVHHGFNLALRRTWRKVGTILDEAQDKPLFLTGHSMGGALAVLAACRLAKIGRPPVATYTFGTPRVGDPAFAPPMHSYLSRRQSPGPRPRIAAGFVAAVAAREPPIDE